MRHSELASIVLWKSSRNLNYTQLDNQKGELSYPEIIIEPTGRRKTSFLAKAQPTQAMDSFTRASQFPFPRFKKKKKKRVVLLPCPARTCTWLAPVADPVMTERTEMGRRRATRGSGGREYMYARGWVTNTALESSYTPIRVLLMFDLPAT